MTSRPPPLMLPPASSFRRASVRRAALPALIFSLAASARPVSAQPAPSALTAEQRRAVVDSIVTTVRSAYVDADTGRRIAESIRTRQAAGTYDTVSNPAALAELLTTDLRRVNGDLHLSVRFVPPGASSGPRISALGPGSEPQRINYGLRRAEILAGNIGYLEISGFESGEFQEAVAEALRFLGRTDALIIDIRRNGGGTSEMSHYVFSHFLPAAPTPTIEFRSRSGTAGRSTTVADVAGPRRTEVPLYVLTSRATGSAAEEFAFVLRNRGRAVTVGSRTAGAGHMVGGARVGHGFVLAYSVARVTDPSTGREWERTGVLPVIDVDPARALDAAYAAALRQVATAAPSASQPQLTRLAQAAEARATPIALPPDAAQLAGAYAGGRRVLFRDGQLWMQRSDGVVPELLTPLGGRRFAMGTTILTFEQGERAPVLRVEPLDGTVLRYAGERS